MNSMPVPDKFLYMATHGLASLDYGWSAVNAINGYGRRLSWCHRLWPRCHGVTWWVTNQEHRDLDTVVDDKPRHSHGSEIHADFWFVLLEHHRMFTDRWGQ